MKNPLKDEIKKKHFKEPKKIKKDRQKMRLNSSNIYDMLEK